MTRCIIHIGMHKTGSTSIQKSLRNLSNDRFLYANLGSFGNHSVAMFNLFAINLNRLPQHIANGRAGNILKHIKIRQQVQLEKTVAALQGRSLIISGEGISDLLTWRELAQMLEYFQARFDEVAIVGYVRPPLGYLTSVFQQRLKDGKVEGNFTSRMKIGYKKRFDKFDKVFGRENVQLWQFDTKSFPGGCVVRDFCTRLGIDLPSTDCIVRANESLSRQAIALLYTYRKYESEAQDHTMKGRESENLIARLKTIGDNKYRFSPEVMRPVLEKNRADIEWMEARLGQSLYEDPGEHRPGDVRNEADLLELDPVAIGKLLALLGDRAPAGVTGETPEQVALLVHALCGEQEAGASMRKQGNEVVKTGTIDMSESFKGQKMQNKKNGQQVKRMDLLSSKDEFDVVVHVGAPKTGSSALQYFLLNNRSLLENYGFDYPAHGLDPNGVSAGHSGLGIQLINGDFKKAKQVFDDYVEHSKRKNLKLLLSSESFFPFAEKFLSLSGDYRVRILGFYRDPLESIVSAYNQLVKRNLYEKSLNVYCQSILKRNAPEFSGEALLRWVDKFGSNNVFIYHYDNINPKHGNNTIENFFLTILGVPDADRGNFSFSKKRINKSYTSSAVELKRLLNKVVDKSNKKMNGKIDVCLQEYSDANRSPGLELYGNVDSEIISSLQKKFESVKESLKAEYYTENASGQKKEFGSTQLESSDLAEPDSLEFVAENAFRNDPESLGYIKNCLCDRLKPGEAKPDIILLVNLFGLQGCKMKNAEKEAINQQLLAVLTDKNSTRFEILYQIGVLLEARGDYSGAYRIMSDLLELRPNGPVLLKSLERIKKHIDIQ